MKTCLTIFILLVFSWVVPAQPNNSRGTSANSLKILSYNVKMLPRFIKRERHFPIKRAHIIPSYLTQEDVDIIVLQEAFDMKANRIFRKQLKAKYPYIIGPENAVCFHIESLLQNNDVCIFLIEIGWNNTSALDWEMTLAFNKTRQHLNVIGKDFQTVC